MAAVLSGHRRVHVSLLRHSMVYITDPLAQELVVRDVWWSALDRNHLLRLQG